MKNLLSISKRGIGLVVCIATGVYLSYLISFKVIYNLMFPNSWATNIELNSFSKIFFEVSADTGGLVEPNNFNIIFTISVGVAIGVLVFVKLNKRINKKQFEQQ